MMTPEQSVVAAILVCLAGALVSGLVARYRTAAGWVAFGATALSAAIVLSAVIQVLSAGPSPQPSAFWAMPRFGFALRLYVDGLTALFLMLAAVIAVAAALYSVHYMRHYAEYGVARYYPNLLLFVAAMYGLLSTTDMMWFFFIFWQLMTLPGYALIRFEKDKRDNVRAANKYLLMMQLACASTMIGAELLAVTGAAARAGSDLKYDFDTVSANLPLLLANHPGTTAMAFGLFLAGFGIKMGMWPFGQVWLPDAHPAAPSPMSAMLSGVMIKTGVYGLMRYFLWLVPAAGRDDYPLANWGALIAILGTITLLTGTVQALKQEQSKRLLAFHSIGQVGYILLGMGVCMALLGTREARWTPIAALGLFGALLHVLNHGAFKALLFLNSGSMLHATGTQDLNRMGGLMKYMPLTGATALVAAFSISGVPLFNGFVSKWSICVSAIQGTGGARYLALCAVIGILTSALTLASFIKFFGVSFLSRTSSLVAQQASRRKRLEVGWTMQLPQIALALICVLLGILPAIAFRLMNLAMEASRQGYGSLLADASAAQGGWLSGVSLLGSSALYAPAGLVAVLGMAMLFSRAVARAGGAKRQSAEPWLCGYARQAECHRYIAHHFYDEIKRYARWAGGAPGTPPSKPKE